MIYKKKQTFVHNRKKVTSILKSEIPASISQFNKKEREMFWVNFSNTRVITSKSVTSDKNTPLVFLLSHQTFYQNFIMTNQSDSRRGTSSSPTVIKSMFGRVILFFLHEFNVNDTMRDV